MAQLGALGLQKGELLKLLSMFPLRHLPLMLSIGCRIRQATRILLGQLPVPALLRKLALKEDLSDKTLCILMSIG
jgi:hypothetical protein